MRNGNAYTPFGTAFARENLYIVRNTIAERARVSSALQALTAPYLNVRLHIFEQRIATMVSPVCYTRVQSRAGFTFVGYVLSTSSSPTFVAMYATPTREHAKTAQAASSGRTRALN